MHTFLGPELVREVQTGGCTCSGAFQVRLRRRRRRMLGCGWDGVMSGVRGWSFRALSSLTVGCAGVSESLSLSLSLSLFFLSLSLFSLSYQLLLLPAEGESLLGTVFRWPVSASVMAVYRCVMRVGAMSRNLTRTRNPTAHPCPELSTCGASLPPTSPLFGPGAPRNG